MYILYNVENNIRSQRWGWWYENDYCDENDDDDDYSEEDVAVGTGRNMVLSISASTAAFSASVSYHHIIVYLNDDDEFGYIQKAC